MGYYTKGYLSESTLGQPIFPSDATETDVHIPSMDGDSDILDELWLYAGNSGTIDSTVTVFFSGQSSFNVGIPASNGLVLVLPGLPVGLGTDVSVIASGTELGTTFFTGYVNNIDQTL